MKALSNRTLKRRARVANGLCGDCGEPQDGGTTRCKRCRKKHADYRYKKFHELHPDAFDLRAAWAMAKAGRPRKKLTD